MLDFTAEMDRLREDEKRTFLEFIRRQIAKWQDRKSKARLICERDDAVDWLVHYNRILEKAAA